MPRKTKDLLGIRFGKLLVIEFGGYIKDKYSSKAYWICQCDCGATKKFPASELINGKKISCGCSRYENLERNEIIGKKFGRLTAIKRVPTNNNTVKYLFRCDCGNEKVIFKTSVVTGKTKSCGCLSNEMAIQRNFKDIKGNKFGKLTALDFYKNEKNKTIWKCACECGNICDVSIDKLMSGKQVSCGCYGKTQIGKRSKTHEKSKTRQYKIYLAMKARCYNPKNPNYQKYGGRGITICQEWLDDFMNFYNWAMDNGYEETLSIDRIDVNGNYEPNNCRWANATQQANNRRTSRYINVNGTEITVAEFCKNYGINSSNFVTRRLDKGIGYEQILNDYKNKKD